jgi:nucleotide-binding universal stress UspA family protein
MEVMVYVDPQPRGEWALALARQVSESWAERLHLVATAEDAAADPGLLARAREAVRAGAQVTEASRPGPAERAVVEEARSRAWGLVIVPPAGRGALARMLRGSRVATVVRAVHAPVLVARRPPARVERVLGALSGRRSTQAVVDATLEWERRTGARASFVHVSAEVPVGVPAEGLVQERDLDRELDRILAVLHRRAATDRLTIRDGLVVDEVLDTFEQQAQQLLVVGARGEEAQGFGREDVTERLLLACPGSTLVVPSEPTPESSPRPGA